MKTEDIKINNRQKDRKNKNRLEAEINLKKV
jgi:hypothetical protein